MAKEQWRIGYGYGLHFLDHQCMALSVADITGCSQRACSGSCLLFLGHTLRTIEKR
jgi:hypothetical protein